MSHFIVVVTIAIYCYFYFTFQQRKNFNPIENCIKISLEYYSIQTIVFCPIILRNLSLAIYYGETLKIRKEIIKEKKCKKFKEKMNK